MRPTPEAERAAALAEALRALPVTIETVAVESGAIAVPSYPGGPRPTSTVRLAGLGASGAGEHVGWTAEEHRTFARAAEGASAPARGARRLSELELLLRERFAAPYDRAALEAAAIDLALRQAGVSLADLVGAEPRPVRYVVSFERTAEPLARLRAEVGDEDGPAAKIDVDPAWTDEILGALGSTGRVAVLDWKRAGAPADHERARRLVPGALQEDPGDEAGGCAAAVADRLSLDAAFTHARALDGLSPRPIAANVKPARMGGVLEALDGIARCMASGIEVYLGGMFELGVGRRQLRDLAALLCPEGPNDVAPIPRGDGRSLRGRSSDGPSSAGRPRPSHLAPVRAAAFGAKTPPPA